MCAIPCDGDEECSLEPGFDESEASGCPIREECEIRLNATETPNNVSSPNYPESYDGNYECSYIFTTASPLEVVQITFGSQIGLEIQLDPNRCFDYVTLYDGGSRGAADLIQIDGNNQFCGYLAPKQATYVSSGQSLTLFFSTDANINKMGWQVTYQSVSSSRAKRSPRISRAKFSKNSQKLSSQNTLSHKGVLDIGIMNKAFERIRRSEQYDSTENETGINSVETDDYFSAFWLTEMPDYSDFQLWIPFTREFIASNGHQAKNFILQCTLDGETCDWSDFEEFQSVRYGNCFTFNSILSQKNIETGRLWLRVRKVSLTV